MEKRKPRNNSTDDIVELSFVKAAAWAWYQHGSGSDGKPMREFDLTRFNNSPKPSRCKLQAINQLQDQTRYASSAGYSLLGVSGNSLLDKFEIERITKQLDLYIESAHHASQHYTGGGSTVAVVGQSGCGMGMRTSKHKKNLREISRGFFLFMHSAICGSRNDVVENRSYRHVRRSQPKEYKPENEKLQNRNKS